MLLVDTFNVLHVTGVMPEHLAGLDVEGLAALIRQSRYARQRVLLICDGTGPARSGRHTPIAQQRGPFQPHAAPAGAGVHICFAGPGASADDLIAAIVQHEHRTRGATVVSNDRAVRARARKQGLTPLAAEAFLRSLTLDADRAERRRPHPSSRPAFAQQVPLDRSTVGQWLQAMGVSAAEIREIESEVARLPHPAPAGRAHNDQHTTSRERAPGGGSSGHSSPARGRGHRGESPEGPSVGPGNPARSGPTSGAGVGAGGGAGGGGSRGGGRGVGGVGGGVDAQLLALLREHGLSDQLASLEMDQWINHAPPTAPTPGPSITPAGPARARAARGARSGGRSRRG